MTDYVETSLSSLSIWLPLWSTGPCLLCHCLATQLYHLSVSPCLRDAMLRLSWEKRCSLWWPYIHVSVNLSNDSVPNVWATDTDTVTQHPVLRLGKLNSEKKLHGSWWQAFSRRVRPVRTLYQSEEAGIAVKRFTILILISESKTNAQHLKTSLIAVCLSVCLSVIWKGKATE